MVSYLNALNAGLPGAPIVVIGCPPASHTLTLADSTAKNVAASAPATLSTTNWKMFGNYSGLGKVGATTLDGTRDDFLSNDGVHPSPAGHDALEQLFEVDIRRDLTRMVRYA